MSKLHFINSFENIFETNQKIILITEENVWNLYQDKINTYVPIEKRILVILPSGEQAKTFETYQKATEEILNQNIHRNMKIFALGGGALSDSAGFVAATLLRGLKWDIIPTTLLSMIDASIGGKVAINSHHGKNLIGAFHPPENIYIDYSFLQTLPKMEKENAKGEILKYAFLSKEIYEAVLANISEKELIKMCAEYKMKITAKDPHDIAERQFLNFGHTLGHALEKAYHLPHGEAVRRGIHFALKIDGHSLQEDLKKLEEKLKLKGLTPLSISAQALRPYLDKDKKNTEEKVTKMVLLKSIGIPYLKGIDVTESISLYL
ncbi:MAG: 3-dehydroquinate synthase [Bacteriovoracaceae bacterium]|nr:3-dehydroquinate synthase [Bacteriovoracaceae bacterium]